jgi:flagellin
MIGGLNNALASVNASISTALNQLSSGQRIVSASVDPAGLQFSTQMAAQISSDGAALSNISDASSLTQTAGGALSQVSDVLQQMRDLAVQAGNGAYSSSDRQVLQSQFSALSGSLDGIALQSQFNGQNLLDGSFSATVASGPGASQTLTISLGNASSSGLGIAGQSIASAPAVSGALTAIDQALAAVAAQQSHIGSAQSTLDAMGANLSASSLNLSSSRSSVADANIAQTSSDLTSAIVKQQVALKAIKLYTSNQSEALALLLPQSI